MIVLAIIMGMPIRFFLFLYDNRIHGTELQ